MRCRVITGAVAMKAMELSVVDVEVPTSLSAADSSRAGGGGGSCGGDATVRCTILLVCRCPLLPDEPTDQVGVAVAVLLSL